MKLIGGYGMKKNQHFVRYHAHRFFKKTPTDDLN